VFGRFVVCKDRAVMDAVSASGAPVDSINLDGDVIRRKGTVSGGYVNKAMSKIITHKRVRGAARRGRAGVQTCKHASTLRARRHMHRCCL
jgi:chromosome segregation ATPase